MNTPKEQTAEYNPIVCDHKIKQGKYNGFSNYEFLSGSSGGSPDGTHDVSLSVCRYCGEIKIQGRRDEKGHTNRFCEEFSIYYPDALAAIVKNCNYMNRETDGYIPFVQVAAHLNQPPTEDKQPGEIEKIRFLLEYLLEHDDGVGICLGYQSREMVEDALKGLNTI